MRMRAPLHLFSSAARSRLLSAPPCKIWGRALYGRSQKRGSSSARARRRCQGRTGYSLEKHIRTHTPVSVTHVHKAKTKATLKERERSASMRRGAGAAADLCFFLETLEREGIKWSGKGLRGARGASTCCYRGGSQRGQTCWDRCIEGGYKNNNNNVWQHSTRRAIKRSLKSGRDGLTGGECAGCACLRAWCGEWASVTRVKRCNGEKWWNECQLSWCVHIAQVCLWGRRCGGTDQCPAEAMSRRPSFEGQKALMLMTNTWGKHTQTIPLPRPQLYTHSFTDSNIRRTRSCALFYIYEFKFSPPFACASAPATDAAFGDAE